ncbi:hypothetical protein O9H85_36050 [Paenibacillus filicis]|uniref:Uncharacterized protein n=1 Tax=Paenibacillus gyeongsangnamensis TaxID=3388067 RepID=A0ABT4QLP9_9BACL|nr:hypothetical protein [Paenibacillus filicis]MCZ8517645.1 hypothetical protein [Paenibacillus filicis]
MSKLFQLLVVLLFAVAFFTVPTQDEYSVWLKSKIKNESNNNFFVNMGVNLLGDAIIKRTTVCNNFIVASYCRTSLDSNNNISAIGAYNRFVLINDK